MVKVLAKALTLAAIVAGATLLPTPLSAQCKSWGPNVKKVGSVPAPTATAGMPAPAAIDPEKVPAWQATGTATLESAAANKQPIVIYFPGEKDGDTSVYGNDYAELSKTKAAFIKIPYTAEREKSPFAEESVVPASKLLSDNLARDYKIPVGQAKFVVCDWFGNDYFQVATTTKAKELSDLIDKVSGKMEDSNKKLQKTFDAAKTAWDKNDRAAALKAILKNFKEGVVGLDAEEATAKLYHEVVDAARTQIGDAKEKSDKAALKTLVKELKGTDAAKEADEALKSLG